MGDAYESDRRELVRRASGGRKMRFASFTREAPTKWHPTSLIDPRSGEPFTEDNCWSYISEAIERGEPVEEITLRKPAGKRGFVLKLAGHDGVTIYVKLQLTSDRVQGRSFHESVGHDDEDEHHG